MANQSGADPAASAAATQAPAPPAKKVAEDELLCTMCGLTACWTAPGKAPRPATPAEVDAANAAPTA